MAYACASPDFVTNVCHQWVEQVTWIDQLAITKVQMAQLGTSIIGVYAVVIAFIMFLNFAKRA